MKKSRFAIVLLMLAAFGLTVLAQDKPATKQAEPAKAKAATTQVEKSKPAEKAAAITPAETKKEAVPAEKTPAIKGKAAHKKYTSKKVKHGKDNVDASKKEAAPTTPEKK